MAWSYLIDVPDIWAVNIVIVNQLGFLTQTARGCKSERVSSVCWFSLHLSTKTIYPWRLGVNLVRPTPIETPHCECKTPRFWCWGFRARGVDELWSNGVVEYWRKRNSKSQIPNIKQITMTKIQNSILVLVIWYWNLGFVCNLVLGVWDFSSPSLHHSNPPGEFVP